MRAWLICAAFLWAQVGFALDWSAPWAERHDAGAAAAGADEYAWRLFVALNWPADPATGLPDRSVPLGVQRPVVWETWANAEDVYRDDGSDPGQWPARSARLEEAVGNGSAPKRFEPDGANALTNLRRVVAGRVVPVIDPVADASRLTEIRMNKTAFDYLRGRELYNVEGQIRAVTSRHPVDFPRGSTEVKARWRPIDAEQRSRYHTVEVRLSDGSTRLYGLTALHLVAKDLPNWFWATFEHVDNPSLADGEGWQLPSRDRFSCRGSGREDCNFAPSRAPIRGTVWQNYRLRGSLTRFEDMAGHPELLANSELERGFQSTSSCMTCHSRAALAVKGTVALRLPVFDMDAAQGSTVSSARRGYVGRPRGAWFLEAGGPGPPVAFVPLDFVWSLSKARYKGD